MFYSNNTLRVGDNEMGGFAKDWLFETSGVAQDINLTINKCKVKAGKNQGSDDFEASGTMVVITARTYIWYPKLTLILFLWQTKT